MCTEVTSTSEPPIDEELESANDAECSICMNPLTTASNTKLPCKHCFHDACLVRLRSSIGLLQVCPLCRARLPPRPEELFEQGARRYCSLQRRVERSEASWNRLPQSLQDEMELIVRLWEDASAQGHADAQYFLGTMCRQGCGTPASQERAVRWFRAAAEQAHPEACHMLATCCATGEGVDQSERDSVAWLKRAAELGHGTSLFKLGCLHLDGRVVERNYKEAARLFELAAGVAGPRRQRAD